MKGPGLVSRSRAVERERVAGPRRSEALRQVDLEDVAGADVIDRPPNSRLVGWPRKRALHDAGGR